MQVSRSVCLIRFLPMLEEAMLFLTNIGRICLTGAKGVLVCSCSSIRIENKTPQRAKSEHRLGFDGTAFTMNASKFSSVASKALLRELEQTIAIRSETAFSNDLFSLTLLFPLPGSRSPKQQRPRADGADDNRCPPGQAGEEGAAPGKHSRGEGSGAAVAGVQSHPSPWRLQ